MVAISFMSILGIGLIAARITGYGLPTLDGVPPQGFDRASFNRSVSLISGHSGFDSGAICTDEAGNLLLAEVDLTGQVTDLVARRLRRAGADVSILEEYDPALSGLETDVLLSIHADSCVDASGYKAANYIFSPIQEIEKVLLGCIDQHYPAATDLAHHPNSVTHDMTSYHAFKRVAASTPAAILEMGFMGGDQELLTRHQHQVAKGIADSIICFLNYE